MIEMGRVVSLSCDRDGWTSAVCPVMWVGWSVCLEMGRVVSLSCDGWGGQFVL